MNNSGSGLDPGSGPSRSRRRAATTNAGPPRGGLGITMQGASLACTTASFGRTRSLSSAPLPQITITDPQGASGQDQSLAHGLGLSAVAAAAAAAAAVDNSFPPSTTTSHLESHDLRVSEAGFAAMDDMPDMSTAVQQQQHMMPGEPLPAASPSIASLSAYANPFAEDPSPYPSPVVYSPAFGSPLFGTEGFPPPPLLPPTVPQLHIFSDGGTGTDYSFNLARMGSPVPSSAAAAAAAAAAVFPSSPRVVPSSSSSSPSPSFRPSLAPLNTHVLGAMPYPYQGSDAAFSGSTVDCDEQHAALMASPLDFPLSPYSSATTSPMLRTCDDTGMQDVPASSHEQCLASSIITANGFPFCSLFPPQRQQQEEDDDEDEEEGERVDEDADEMEDQYSEQDGTPTSLSRQPNFQQRHQHQRSPHLQVPMPGDHHHQISHRRRTSDPGPDAAEPLSVRDSVRLGRSHSHNGQHPHPQQQQRQRQQQQPRHQRTRGRSRSGEARRQAVQQSLQAGEPLPARAARSPTPGQSERGRRSGPMEETQRRGATERRRCQDICIGCKCSRIRCEPSGDSWGSCRKCHAGLSRTTVPQLCGSWYFAPAFDHQTLDYTTLYYITPLRLASPVPSRRLLFLPSEFDIRSLSSHFSYLVSQSISTIRVSSSPPSSSSSDNTNNHLFDISLPGALRYLSGDLITALASTRSFPFFISRLTRELSDGWLACLAPADAARLATPRDVLRVLHPWTTQQGCFHYTLVSDYGGISLSSLDPDDHFGRTTILFAAQLTRLIARKVEKIGLEALQGVLPNGSGSNTRPTPENAPDPFIVRLLGQLALASRFRCRLWELQEQMPQQQQQQIPSPTAASSSSSSSSQLQFPFYHPALLNIPLDTRSKCFEANRLLMRSLYTFYGWLARAIVPLPIGLGLEASISISSWRYPGAINTLREPMSKGEDVSGFAEWWAEGKAMVREASMDAVVADDLEGLGPVGAAGDVMIGPAAFFP